MSYSVARTVMGRATISTVKLDFMSKDMARYETMIFKDNDDSLSFYQGKSDNLQDARQEHIMAIQYLLMKEYLKGESNDNNQDNE
jgi:hypothetical protein